VIFVDTSFWFGLAVPRDARHVASRRLLLAHGNDRLLTSNAVVGETWTLLRRRLGHAAAIAFSDAVEQTPRLQSVFVGPEIEREAWSWLRRHDERPYSFVDATSFALMRSLRIREALAFDGDFSAAGFVELRA
jgi:predicted nucleic acid-binding protein